MGSYNEGGKRGGGVEGGERVWGLMCMEPDGLLFGYQGKIATIRQVISKYSAFTPCDKYLHILCYTLYLDSPTNSICPSKW